MPVTFTIRARALLWFYFSFLSVIAFVPWYYFLVYAGQYVLNPSQAFPLNLLYVCLGVSVLMAIAVGFIGWQTRQMRLIFTHKELVYQGLYAWQNWRYPYAEITYVLAYAYGVDIFKTVHGKTQLLALSGWQGPNTTALAELRRRLPAERLAPDLEQGLRKVRVRDVLSDGRWQLLGARPFHLATLAWLGVSPGRCAGLNPQLGRARLAQCRDPARYLGPQCFGSVAI